MRTGISSIQQTLTPEAATVLNQSIAEAGRRNHGQTTPLHVAATLLASPSGFLRQACIKSHPNSSHPLQCRALELCFSVALERLPTSQNVGPGMEPPISNALMAALKRAQAHQRRGCPEQQQQPLLAVKVELEQLIISILDDPSVSRVMREASFSSPAVKATIEQSLSTSSQASNSATIGLGFRPATVTPTAAPNRNLLNPRLQQGRETRVGQQRGEEVKKVYDILLRTRKRNPVLVGESEPEAVIKELLKKIENKELGEGLFTNVKVIHLEKELPSDRAKIPTRLKELGDLIGIGMGNPSGGSGSGGFLLNLGDLKWLVEQPVGMVGSGTAAQQAITEAGRAVVVEMRLLLARFGVNGSGRLWLIGTATCETYLRCQVYHPSMENDWDLQAVPIAARAPLPGMFQRLGSNGMLGSSLESFSPLRGFPAGAVMPPRRPAENLDSARRTSCCPQCTQSCEQELADIIQEFEKSTSEIKSEPTQSPLPQWLQNAKANSKDAKMSKSQEVIMKNKTEELWKKWSDTCSCLHPNFHQKNLSSERFTPTTFSMTGLYNLNLVGRQPFQLKVNKNLGGNLQLNPNPVTFQPSEQVVSPPGSPVKTDLVLGQTKVADPITEKTHKERIKDFLGCISSEPQYKLHEPESTQKLGIPDADSFKKLLNGLIAKVWWQRDAAYAVATVTTQCKLGNGKRCGNGTTGNVWLLFMGPDRVGKRKMASALSEQVPGSSSMVIPLGLRRDDREPDVNLRGKTALDRIVEVVRRNPFSVITLDDIDEADMLLRASIKQAMVRGRLADSHGREISLGNVIFILTTKCLPDNHLKYLENGKVLDEEKLAHLARGDWQIRLLLSERTVKRRACWVAAEEDRTLKPRKEIGSALGFDLNEAAEAEDDRGDGSHNSSDLTVDHEDDHGLQNRWSPQASTIPQELLSAVDDAIIFKPVDFSLIRRNIKSSIVKRFSAIMGNIGMKIEVQGEALERMSFGVWVGDMGMEEWVEKVLVPSFHQLKECLAGASVDEMMVVRLEADGDSDSSHGGDWLPSRANVMVVEA